MNLIRRLSGDVSGIYKLDEGNPEFTVRYNGVVYLRGETFRKDIAKYLCNAAVEKLFEDSTKRAKRITLTVSCDMNKGITIVDASTQAKLAFDLQSIAFSCVDLNRPKVFSFLADIDGCLQCHVFVAEREDKARLITLTMKNTFEEAFSKCDRNSQKEERIKRRKTSVKSTGYETLEELDEVGWG